MQHTRKTLHELGYKTFRRPQNLPQDFKVTFSDKKCGMVYSDPLNPTHNIRVMPGNPASPYPCQQKPYVVHRIGGHALDKNGNFIHTKSESAHIPIDEYVFKITRGK